MSNPPNPFGPTPLAAVGFIGLQTLFVFEADQPPLISADGWGVVAKQGGVLNYLDSNGTVSPLPADVGGYVGLFGLGIGPLIANVWRADYPGRLMAYVPRSWAERGPFMAQPYTEINPAVQAFNELAVIDNGDYLTRAWAIPAIMPNFDNGSCDYYFAGCPFAGNGSGNGGNYLPIGNLKIDDFNNQERGIYNNIIVATGIDNFGVRLSSDPRSVPVNVYDVPMVDMNTPEVTSYFGGSPMVENFNEFFLENPYVANFPCDVLGNTSNPNICLGGINCNSVYFNDGSTNRVLPPRLAQDQYLNGLASATNGNGQMTSNKQFVLPTRLNNSASYIQTMWQRDLAINETMDQAGISPDYPEMQLASAGLFGSDGSVKYYYVLPQNFVKYDIVDSPDLLWGGTNGAIYAVYHDANGLYYFMVGGTQNTYQSAVVNFRYPYQLS